VLRIFRSQGSILYEDEFRSENTANYDDCQTTGRVNRVFRAIEMMSKFKAAHGDGADFSISVIRDSGIVWYDHMGNVLPSELMHNLRQVKDELKNRSPENSPVKVFWMGQELQRSKWASIGLSINHGRQNHLKDLDDSKSPMGATYYGEHYLGQLSYAAINQDHGSTEPFLAVTACGLQNQAQQALGWLNQGTSLQNHAFHYSQQPSTVLDSTIADFIPSSPNTSLPALTPEASTQELSSPGSINPSCEPTTPKTALTAAELIAQGQKEHNWQDRDDEYWPGDHIFIPTFCRVLGCATTDKARLCSTKARSGQAVEAWPRFQL
jgi:hypothetical protein